MKKIDEVLKDCVRTISENTMLMWGYKSRK